MATISETVRVTIRDGAMWRTCEGCGSLAALPPEVDRCEQCEPPEAARTVAGGAR